MNKMIKEDDGKVSTISRAFVEKYRGAWCYN